MNPAALRTGRLQELMDLMAADVVLIADGGGIAAAVMAPIQGAERVAKLLARADRPVAAFETAAVWLNAAPAGRIEIDGDRPAVRMSRDERMPGSGAQQADERSLPSAPS